MRLHVRAPPGTRIEQTQDYFAQVEAAIRQIVGADRSTSMLDNIGLPYSGINIALSDSATVGPMDGEILISLKEKHTPTAALMAQAAPRAAASGFRDLQFFFQPADIVDQVLNFGQPAPIDIRVSGPDSDADLCAGASASRGSSTPFPASSMRTSSRCPTRPALTVDVDRTLATQVGMTQRTTANNVLVATNSSAQTAPNFWVDPKNGVSYPLVVQHADLSHRPRHRICGRMPVTAAGEPATAPAADECRRIRPTHRAAGDLAAQHPAGVRRARQCAGP